MKIENLTSQQRKYIILDRLINQEHLSYQQLSDEYFVSRSSIANDISYIKKLMDREGVEISFDNSGTYLKGSEVKYQKIIKQIVLTELSQKKENYFVDVMLLSKLSSIFDNVLKQNKLDIPESYGQNIVVAIMVMIQRGRKGKFIDFQEKSKLEQLISGFNIYPFTKKLLKKIEDTIFYKFSLVELDYLSYIIAGSGWHIFEINDSVPLEFQKETQIFIKKVSESIQLPIADDQRLQEELSIHLYQFFLRTESQNLVYNPLTKEMKKNYPALYGIVWLALQDFDKHYPLELSDGEIVFIVIHFQAAIERSKKIKQILLVCPNGVGTSSFISAKIAHILPSDTSIKIASVTQLDNVDLSNIAFIVTTTDLQVPGKMVIKVTALMTTKDLKVIMNHYIDLVEAEQSNDTLLETISKQQSYFDHIYFKNLNTKQEVLEYMLEKQTFSSDVQKHDLITSLWDRESIGTYLGNGFVMPHANPKYVMKKQIDVLILDKPIDWDRKKVEIIILLIVPEGFKGLEPIMRLIIRGINNKEWFISKIIAESNLLRNQ